MADKIKLLLVDDEKQFLETISTRLGMRDFDVTAVSSGRRRSRPRGRRNLKLPLLILICPE